MPNYNGVWSLTTQAQYASDWPFGVPFPMGVFMGGAGSAGNVISSLNISTLGNSDDSFGTLSTSKEQCTTVGSNTHAFRMGGDGNVDSIFRVAYTTGGSATDYADLAVGVRYHGGFGNATRGFALGGAHAGSANGYNNIQLFLYDSTGDATDFGDMSTTAYYVNGSSNSTRGLYNLAALNNGSTARSDTIEYITLASAGNGTDFGNLTTTRRRLASTSSATRTLFGGGDTSSATVNTIDYVTTASTGNATDFGDLSTARNRLPAVASTTRGVFAGGYGSSSADVTIDFVTIASTGNATDFGDMSTNHYEMSGGASSASAAVS